MRTILVNPPLFYSNYPPLGLMSLYMALDRAGYRSTLLDLNYLAMVGELYPNEGFLEKAAELVISNEPDVLGLTSCVGNYAVALELARLCKEQKTDIVTILGGPQATIVAQETLHDFPYVDAIVLGEGEASFPDLIRAIDTRSDLSSVAGIVFRNDNEIIQTDNRELLDLDTLPMIDYKKIMQENPGYDLVKFRLTCIEIGRGCCLNCAFCCVNRIWRKTYRMKSTERCLAEIHDALMTLPGTNIEFLHDSPTIDRGKVVELCNAIRQSGMSFNWAISSRIDFLDQKILELLKSAGCSAIFVGLESASPRIQKLYNKSLDMNRAYKVVEEMVKIGIDPTISFIIGHPEETVEEILTTLRAVLDLAIRGTKDFRLEILAPHPGTPVTEAYEGREWFYPTTISYELPIVKKLARMHPRVFPQSYIFKQCHDSLWILKYLAGYQIFLSTFAKFPRTVSQIIDQGIVEFEELLHGYIDFIKEYLTLIEDRNAHYGESMLLLTAINFDRFPAYLQKLIERQDKQYNLLTQAYDQEKLSFEKYFARNRLV